MPKISLYIDKNTFEKIEKAAESEKLSNSGWVGKQLKRSLHSNYPDSFQNLFGFVDDETFTIPEKEPFDVDADRETL